jgi:hypothetical protein
VTDCKDPCGVCPVAIKILRSIQDGSEEEAPECDGGPLTPKSAPGAAGGPSGKETSTHHLFPSKMVKTGEKAGADHGGAHAQGARIGTPGGGTQHAPRPAPGATAGEAAGKGPTSRTVQDRGPTVNKSTWRDKRQNTGDSGDTAQQHRMTLGTACGIFTRLRYSTENGANAIILSGIQDGRTQWQRPDATDNGAPGAGETYARPDEEIPGTRTRAADNTTNGSAAEGIDNREIDGWKAIHTSNTAATSKSNGVPRITAQHLSMTPPTDCGILNRLGNNEEDVTDNEIFPKNTLGVNNSGSKTHPYPEVPPRSIREAEHKKAPQAGIGVTFEPKKTWEGYVVQQVLQRPHQIITRDYPLAPGAVLFEVDEKSVADKSPEELTAVLSGPKGTTVSLGLKMDGKTTYVSARIDMYNNDVGKRFMKVVLVSTS